MKRNRTIAYVLAIALLTTSVVGSITHTYGRPIERASNELIYTPVKTQLYDSDCLISGGQRIALAPWQAEENERVVVIKVLQPEPTVTPEPLVTQDAEASLTPAPTETPAPEMTVIPEATVTPEAVVTATPEPEVTPEPVVTHEPMSKTEDDTDLAETTEDTKELEVTEEIENVEETTESNGYSDVTITMDDVTALHFACRVVLDQENITLTLERIGTGIPVATEMSIHVVWQGLEGTFVFELMPYGENIGENTIEEIDHVIKPNLELFWCNDTIDKADSILCVKLNVETQSNFVLSFLQGEQGINRVRWSLDGENYTLLYDATQLELFWPYVEDWEGNLYLDFSKALDEGQRPTVVIKATGYDRREIKPIVSNCQVIQDAVVLSKDMPCVIGIDTLWGQTELEIVGVQHLVLGSQGYLEYQDEDNLKVQVGSGGIYISTNKAISTEFGTYRILYRWVWEDMVVNEDEFYVFINDR